MTLSIFGLVNLGRVSFGRVAFGCFSRIEPTFVGIGIAALLSYHFDLVRINIEHAKGIYKGICCWKSADDKFIFSYMINKWFL